MESLSLAPPIRDTPVVLSLLELALQWVGEHLHLYTQQDLDLVPIDLQEQLVKHFDKRRGDLTDGSVPGFIQSSLSTVGSPSNLKLLNLRGCYNLSDASILYIAQHCPALQNLNLAMLNITDASLTHITHLHDLRSLDISGCTKVTDDGLKAISLRLNQLQHLRCGACNRITDFGIQALARSLPHMETLTVSNCRRVTILGVQCIVEHIAGLRVLDIGGLPAITDYDISDVCKSGLNLTDLTFRTCRRVTNKAMRSVANLVKRKRARGLPSLTRLDIAGCERIDGPGFALLIDEVTTLTHLDVSGLPSCDDEIVRRICESMPDLQRLIVRGCPLVTAELIGQIKNILPTLQLVYVAYQDP